MWHRIVIILLLLFGLPVQAADVHLAWDANTDSTPGYKLHRGQQSRVYTETLDVGNVTARTWPTPDGTWYFAATAYDAQGFESGYSNEVSYSAPLPPAPATAVNVSWSEVGQSVAVFGIQTTGTPDFSCEDIIRGAVAAPASSGTTTKITAYIKETSADNAHTCKCLLYDAAGNLVGESAERSDITITAAWVDFSISVPVISGNSYFIAFWGNSAAGAIRLGQTAQTGEGRWRNATYGTAPDPVGTLYTDDQRYSIYVTYTETGGGVSIPVIAHHLRQQEIQ